MERNVKIVCCVVGVLGLLCAATGFAAQATRTTKIVPPSAGSPCSYPGSPAFGLGITAAVCLTLAQIIIAVATRCTCCRFKRTDHTSSSCFKRTDHTSSSLRSNLVWQIYELFLVVLCWVGFGVASTYLLAGAYINHKFVPLAGAALRDCPLGSRNLFAEATVLGLLSLAAQLMYYRDVNSKRKDLLPTTQGDVAIGQPQFPPREVAQDPVVVHKDTY